jgi:hypothetical protein
MVKKRLYSPCPIIDLPFYYKSMKDSINFFIFLTITTFPFYIAQGK